MVDPYTLCALCRTPEIEPNIPNCECVYDRLDEYNEAVIRREAAITAAFAKRDNADQFSASLPERYRAYLSVGSRLIDAKNPEAAGMLAGLSKGSFVYLHGKPGRGKTHVAVRSVARLLSPEFAPLFVQESDFIDAEQARAKGEHFVDYLKCDGLVLDEFARRRVNVFALERIARLLEYRWAHMLPTVITSNLSPADAASRLGDDEEMVAALHSRLTCGHVFEIVGSVDGRLGTAK